MTMAVLSPTSRKPRFIAGGPDDDSDDQQSSTPARMRYECCANGCPMPGTMFPSGGSRGICCYHYATNASDWPRITKVLADWRCVTFEINECRRVLCDQDICTDVKAQNDAFRSAWERLMPALDMGGWNLAQLAPKPGEGYSNWARRLDEFLGGQVVAALRHKVGSTS